MLALVGTANHQVEPLVEGVVEAEADAIAVDVGVDVYVAEAGVGPGGLVGLAGITAKQMELAAQCQRGGDGRAIAGAPAVEVGPLVAGFDEGVAQRFGRVGRAGQGHQQGGQQTEVFHLVIPRTLDKARPGTAGNAVLGAVKV